MDNISIVALISFVVALIAVVMIPVGVSVSEVGWLTVLGTAVLAGVVSLLTSIAGLPDVKE